MGDDRPVTQSRRSADVVALFAVAIGFAAVLAAAAPTLGSTVAGALVVPLAVLLGRPGVLGIGGGAMVYATLTGGTIPTVVAFTAGYLAFAAGGEALWETLRREAPGAVRGHRWPLAVAGTVAVASLLHAATFGLVAVTLGNVAFVSVVPARAVATLVPAVLLGPPLLWAGTRVVGPLEPVPDSTPRQPSRVVVAVLTTLVWVGGGLALSTVAHDLRHVTDPAGLVGSALPGEVVGALFTLLVGYGQVVQVLVGGVALSLCALAVRSRSEAEFGGEETPDAPNPILSDGGDGHEDDETDPYRLSRRDAVVALGVLGLGAGAGHVSQATGRPGTTTPTTVERLTAVARAVYPTSVTATPAFLGRYVTGRSRVDEAYLEAVETALAVVDQQARLGYGTPLVHLSAERCATVLRELGVNSARPDPTGSDAARVRYYLVDDLLYALFTTPVGGRLVGIENPPGYAGGHEAYQRAPGEVSEEEAGR